MAKILKFKRGNTVKNTSYTGSDGELTVDTSKKTVVVHDGVTAGGSVLATESLVGTKINATEKAVANGVATLDVNGKVVLSQIPDSVLGQLEYMGVYDFASGMPIATQKGQYWIASTDGNGYITGDWAVWNGTSFDKVDNTDAVATVAGRTGNVVLTKNDVGLSNVDNTSDANKPVSTATQNALNLKANDNTVVKLTGNETIAGVKTFSSNIVGNITGNSGTATKLSTTRNNYKNVTDTVVAGELMWKNYGNNHTIFDASNSTSPTGASVNNTNPDFVWDPTKPTLMGYNGENTYGVRVDSSRYADQLKTARTINGVAFDGSTNISVGLGWQEGVFSTSFTLNNTHKNKLLVCSNGITITLPTINTIKSGDLFYITNSGLEPLTLALNGNSTNLNTLNVTGGETLVIQSDGGSFYRCISRKSTPIYDFDTNLITPLGYNTVYRADVDITLVVICHGIYMNGIEIVIGTTTSPTRVVSRAGDDINNNTKYATLTAVITAGLYFKVQGFGVYGFENIEITSYKHK